MGKFNMIEEFISSVFLCHEYALAQFTHSKIFFKINKKIEALQRHRLTCFSSHLIPKLWNHFVNPLDFFRFIVNIYTVFNSPVRSSHMAVEWLGRLLSNILVLNPAF